jgi:hypothetical protein
MLLCLKNSICSQDEPYLFYLFGGVTYVLGVVFVWGVKFVWGVTFVWEVVMCLILILSISLMSANQISIIR